jgi:hypothetical protein
VAVNSKVVGLAPGLPDGIFSYQNPKLGKFWRALEWKMLVYFMSIRNILWQFGIFHGNLVYFYGNLVAIWYISWQFGIFYGNLVAIWYILWQFSGNLVQSPFWYIMSRKIWQLCFLY